MVRRSLAALFFAVAAAGSHGRAVAAGASALDAPPAGLVPTTARLADILAAHDRAAGSPVTPVKDTVIEHWRFIDSGLAGTEILERSGTNYHSTIEQGPFQEQYGQLDGKRWHQNYNGFTSPVTSVDDVSFTAVRVLEDAADPKNDVTVVGETAGDHPAYVLQVKGPGRKHPEWIFYDKATAQIVRVESVVGRRRAEQTYDDFRTTGNVTQAWHVHDTDGRTELDDDWHLTELHQGVDIPASTFAPPVNRPASDVSARGPVPSTFLTGYWSGTVIVRLNIAGRGLDFELDASQAESVIERSVAEELNLPIFGQVTHLQTGAPVGYETILPDADLGPAHLHGFRIRSESFTYRARNDVRVVGLLGSDFFASHVVHIDFVHQLVEIFPTGVFAATKPVDGGVDLPIAFEDGLLLVPMQFGSAFTDRVLLSSATPYTIAFGSFYEENKSEFQDAPGAKSEQNVPFADRDSVGEHLEVWLTRTSGLRFAVADFGKHAFLATNFSPESYQVQIDAIIGADYLHYFDLYFDYPHDRFIVAPNDWFRQLFTQKET
jgi:hypothetical protein